MWKNSLKLFILPLLLVYLVSCSGGGGGGSAPKGEPDPDNSPISEDTSAPGIRGLTAVSDKMLKMEFSEAVEPESAETVENYIIKNSDSAVQLTSAVLDSDSVVMLELQDAMEHSVTYNCFVKDVADVNGNKMSGSTRNFTGRGAVHAELTNTPASITLGTSIEVGVSGIDIVAYKFKIDDNDWSGERNTSSKITKAGLSEGNHRLDVIGKDSMGNWQPENGCTRYNWEIDTTAPVASLGSLPQNITVEKKINITVSGVFAYKYKINDDPWSSEVQGNLAMSDLEDGTYKVSVIGRDFAGNWQEESSATEHSWKIDSSQPVAELSGLPSVLTNTQSAAIYVGGTGVTVYKYRVDSGAWSSEKAVSENITLASLSEGTHLIEVLAGNEAGTWQDSATPGQYSWTIDITPPSASLTQVPSSPSSELRPDIRVGGTDVVNYKYKIDDGQWSTLLSASQMVPLSDLAEGNHTIYVVGSDSAGNFQANSSAASHSWTVDRTPPVASFKASSLPASLTNSQSESLTVSSSDIKFYRYKLDSEDWSSDMAISSPSISLSSDMLTEGDHVIKLIGRDTAGNWQAVDSAASHSWTVDITPPAAVTLANKPSNPTSSGSASISVTSTDAVSYKYSLNGGDWETGTIDESILLGTLSEATHSLVVKGIDGAGNEQTTDTTYSWVVDQTATTALLSNLPAVKTNQTGATITVGGTDMVAYKYNVNDSGWSSEVDGADSISLSDLAEGAQTIAVIAKDSADNWQESDAATVYNWTVDLTAPTATLASTPAALTNVNTLNVDVAGTDVVFYRYRLDGGSWSADLTASDNITPVPGEGNHTLEVIGRDSAGNWQDSSSATSYSWTVDLTAPTAPAVSDSGSSSTTAGLVFSWTNGDDVEAVKIQVATDSSFSNVVFGGTDGATIGKVATYTYPANISAGGTYYARVKAADGAGNWTSYGSASDGISLVGSISVTVKNTSNAALSGATGVLKKGSGDSEVTVATVTSDSSGDIVFNNVEVGNNIYTLDITMSGYNGASKNNISVNIGSESDQGIVYLVPEAASPGVFSGKIINANDGAKIAGATIEVLNWIGDVVDTQVSNSSGQFTSARLDPGTYSIKITNDSYFPLVVDNQTIDGNRSLGNQAICEELPPYQLRVVLLWGDSPRDLDLHMVGPSNGTIDGDNTFHIYWQKKSFNEGTEQYLSNSDPTGTSSTSSLVQDATSGYGPEAINLFHMDSGPIYANGLYRFTVHRYSGSSWYSTPITMRIFDTEGLWQEIPVSSHAGSDSNKYWKVFEVDIQGPERTDRTIRIVNEFATLSYNSKSSMDWGEPRGGLTGFLISVASGDPMALTLFFIGLLIIISLLYFLNRRRYRSQM